MVSNYDAFHKETGNGRLSQRSSVVLRYIHSTPLAMKDYPPHILFPMPALSPTMTIGTIASWNVKEGEEFKAGDVLCAIETDKATMDFESQDDGILAKILKSGPTAADIPVGTPICVVVEDEEYVAAFADFVDDSSTSAEDSPAPAATPPATATPVSGTAAHAAPERQVPTEYALLPSARFLAESK